MSWRVLRKVAVSFSLWVLVDLCLDGALPQNALAAIGNLILTKSISRLSVEIQYLHYLHRVRKTEPVD